ncbi:hypothetical protein [Capnocytophaga cynodegmi]|uniref:hypothetical protein n=1 Tax=Capnocytophaga cynodegmi TaxID=28189 RepID=UPI00385D31E2
MLNKKNFKQNYISPEKFDFYCQTGTEYEGFVVGKGYAWVWDGAVFPLDYAPKDVRLKYKTDTPIRYTMQVLDVSTKSILLSFQDENEHEYTIDEKGNIVKVEHKEGSKTDNLHTKENWDKGIKNRGISFKDQSLLQQFADKTNRVENKRSYWGDMKGVWAKTNSKAEAYKLFKFVSDTSTQAEWSLLEFKKLVENTIVYIYQIGTFNNSEYAGNFPPPEGYTNLDLATHFHSHPGTSERDDKASGLSTKIGDIAFSSYYVNLFLKNGKKLMPAFVIYRPHKLDNRGNLVPYKFQYTPWYDFSDPIPIKGFEDLWKNLKPIKY